MDGQSLSNYRKFVDEVSFYYHILGNPAVFIDLNPSPYNNVKKP